MKTLSIAFGLALLAIAAFFASLSLAIRRASNYARLCYMVRRVLL